ncbi:MAG TPA: ATP-binding cassette domain-containing protein [Ktedonobacterales bacterium]
MGDTLVNCDNLVKIYKVANIEVVALQGLDLEVARGEMVALVGASGSGKSTLLNILGGLDTPSAGRCMVAGVDLARLDDESRATYRRRMVGHVWQQSGRNLFPHLTVAENVDVPQTLGGATRRGQVARTTGLLERVGLAAMTRKRPYQLSGGEQQRVAIAVALANDPPLLLADEPTGELDSTTASEILAMMRNLNAQFGLTVILVTHDPAIAACADRTIAIRDGRTSTETIRRAAPLATGHSARVSAVIGLSDLTHRESILIDRAGRLQLPRDILEQARFNGRADVRFVGDHVELWPVTSEGPDLSQASGAKGQRDISEEEAQ